MGGRLHHRGRRLLLDAESFNRYSQWVGCGNQGVLADNNGQYCLHELGIRPEALDPKPDVDFTQLCEQAPTASGFGAAA
ncbi:hypothetical protein [Streptomyces sp. NPDC003006]